MTTENATCGQEESKGLSHLAYEIIDGAKYPPFIASERDDVPELTWKAIITGVIIGIVFGAANAYLGLRVGLTVSASIPAAVMGVAAFKLFGRGSILEANLVQTVGSAGESLAAGVIFTLPALFMWGLTVSQLKVCVLSLLGGLLGVFFMIPLRRYLIVKEHGRLPYPEGTACAEVLVAGETGGSKARLLFAGMSIGALFQTLVHDRLFRLWNKVPSAHIPGYRGAEVAGDLTPELLGIGYIIGPRISAVMLSGGVLGWLVLIPLIYLFGDGLVSPLYPEMKMLIRDMAPGQIWSRYIRYIGAGAVAFAGIFTLIKSLPTIFESFRLGLGGLRQGQGQAVCRTDRDIPMGYVASGVAVIVIIMALLPASFIPVGITGALVIAMFSFFFVTVSSRIVGLIGSSSNPVSGMTIATLLITCLIFIGLGMAGPGNVETAKVAVLIVGSIVCIAAAIAGDTSQDLKTGFLVGATPRHQQVGEIVGVITAALVMGTTLILLNTSYGFGDAPGQLAAPQATLMKLVIEGVLKGNLPWTLVIIGMFISMVMELLSLPALALAVGLYLPLELSTPIMAGGVIRLLVEGLGAWKAGEGSNGGAGGATEETTEEKMRREKRQDSREKGVLFSSGLIAGSALAGVLIAGMVYFGESSVGVRNFLEKCGQSGLSVDSVAQGVTVSAAPVSVAGKEAVPAIALTAGERIPFRSIMDEKEMVTSGDVIVVAEGSGGKAEEKVGLISCSRSHLAVSADAAGKPVIKVSDYAEGSGTVGLVTFVVLCLVLLGASKLGR